MNRWSLEKWLATKYFQRNQNLKGFEDGSSRIGFHRVRRTTKVYGFERRLFVFVHYEEKRIYNVLIILILSIGMPVGDCPLQLQFINTVVIHFRFYRRCELT